jgi:hypothetical protein
MLTHKSFGTLLQIASQHFLHQILLKMDKNWNFKQEFILHLLPFYHVSLIWHFRNSCYFKFNSYVLDLRIWIFDVFSAERRQIR